MLERKINPEINWVVFFSGQNLRLRRIALISCLLFILYCGGAAVALEGPGNVTALIVGSAGEESEGDPDEPVITGGVVSPEPETTGIEHEDIGIAGSSDTEEHDPGITILESGATTETGIEKDDLGIAGSSEEEAGKVETEFKVEKSEKSAPDENNSVVDEEIYPDEFGRVKETEAVGFGDGITGRMPEGEAEKTQRDIVIKGSKIKENFAQTGAGQTPKTDFTAVFKKGVETEDDLEAFAVAVVASDENIEEVAIGEGGVSMSYRYPAKLLWIVDVDYTMTTTVDRQGRVTVQIPWWLFLTQNTADDIAGELESVLATIGDDAQLANIDLQSTLQKQQQTLQTMSNVAKAKHDAAMASIRNMK